MHNIAGMKRIEAVATVNAIIKNPQKFGEVRAKPTLGAIVTIEQDRRAEFVADILYLLHDARCKSMR